MIHYNYHCRVYYKDIDTMGVVYYTRYLEYFEAARTELLREVGLDVTYLETLGFYLPVIAAHCEYKSGARFEDELVIDTRVSELPKLRLRIDYQVRKNGGKQLLVSGYTIHVFTSKVSGKPTRPPKILLEKFKPYFG